MKSVVAAIVIALVPALAWARGTYDPGASDTEIKLGNTLPYSGPVSVHEPARAPDGRLFPHDQRSGRRQRPQDQFHHPRRWLSFRPRPWSRPAASSSRTRCWSCSASSGRRPRSRCEPYLNASKVPQLFVTTGSNTLINPKKYPWTMGFAVELRARRPRLRQIHSRRASQRQDRHPLSGGRFRQRPYRPVPRRARRQGEDDGGGEGELCRHRPDCHLADHFAPRAPAPIRSISSRRAAPRRRRFRCPRQAGWNALIFMPYVATREERAGAVGDDKLKGVMSTDSTKDPTDPGWADDPAVKDYLAWVKKYTPPQDQAVGRAPARRLYLGAGDGRGAEALRRRC